MNIIGIERQSESLQQTVIGSHLLTRFSDCLHELASNSLDAGSTLIHVDLNLDSNSFGLSIADNGEGLNAQLLQELCNYGHVKSVGSKAVSPALGYRNRALATLLACSRAEIMSRAKGSFQTYCYTSSAEGKRTCGLSQTQLDRRGTIVHVQDLFYNMPVRREAIRSHIQLEIESCRDVLLKLAFVRPAVEFKLSDLTSGTCLLSLPAGRSSAALIADYFSLDIKGCTAVCNEPDGFLSLKGFTAMPPTGHPTDHRQILYVNGCQVSTQSVRCVIDELYREIYKASKKAGVCPPGTELLSVKAAQNRYPMYVLHLRCPPTFALLTSLPDGSAVEFKDWEYVLQVIERSLMTAWGSALPEALVAKLEQPLEMRKNEEARDLRAPCVLELPKIKRISQQGSALGSRPVGYVAAAAAGPTRVSRQFHTQPIAKRPRRDAGNSYGPIQWYRRNSDKMAKLPPPTQRIDELFERWSNPALVPDPMTYVPSTKALEMAVFTSLKPGALKKDDLQQSIVISQIDCKFVLMKAGSKLALVDQHAADERVQLETLKAAVITSQGQPRCDEQGSYLNSLALLEPVDLRLAPDEKCLFETYSDRASAWGWKCARSPLGERYVVTHVPLILGTALTPTDLKLYLHQLKSTFGGNALPAAISRVLNSKACRGAIMFGDSLNRQACSKLLYELGQTDLWTICAHGRPTVVPLVDLELLGRALHDVYLQKWCKQGSADWTGLRAKLKSDNEG